MQGTQRRRDRARRETSGAARRRWVAISARIVCLSVTGVALPFGAQAQAPTVPLRFDLSASSKEVTMGATITVSLKLKNLRDESTPALEDLPVTLVSSALDKAVVLVIPKGRSSAEIRITPAKPGLATIQAKSPKMPAGFLLLAVKPAAALRGPYAEREKPPEVTAAPRATALPPTTQPRASGEGEGNRQPLLARRARRTPTTAAPRISADRTEAADRAAEDVAPSPLPPPIAALIPSPKLAVEVVPDEVDPIGSVWTADVAVALVNAQGDAVIADREVPLRLSASFGRLSMTAATIRIGQIATTEDIRLEAQRTGTDVVAALSPLGRAERPVVFNAPPPTKLRVETNPSEVLNDGRSVVYVSVFLLDADNHATKTIADDVSVELASSLGQLKEHRITIPRGDFAKDTTLTSTRHGQAHVSAEAAGLEGATAAVRFLFPWIMVLLATAGGVAGAFARSGRSARHIGWNLLLGALLGMIFYILVFFGAIAEIPKVPIAIGQIAAVNELGALALGFIGGYYGRRLWSGAGLRGGAPSTRDHH